MEKIKLEYLIKTQPQVLFNHISTPDGLSTWFADDVSITEDLFIFKWRGFEQAAKVSKNHKKMFILIDWIDEEKILEMTVTTNSITNDVTLTVIDCLEEGELKEDMQMLWDSQIQVLKRRLGAN